jgi:plastocyanin
MTRPTLSRRLNLAAAAVFALAVVGSPVLAAEHAVAIAGKAFEPATITVAPGDTVTWTVTTSIGEAHSVTSGKQGEPNAGSVFDSGVDALQNDGQTYQRTFAEAGTFDYYCIVHPADMTGQVIVAAPGSSPPAAEPPPSEVETGIPPESRLLAAGILVVSIVLMFGLAWVWRRMNPA